MMLGVFVVSAAMLASSPAAMKRECDALPSMKNAYAAIQRGDYLAAQMALSAAIVSCELARGRNNRARG